MAREADAGLQSGPRPALETVVREVGAEGRQRALLVLVILTLLPALFFGLLRFAGKSPSDDGTAWMYHYAPHFIAIAVGAIGLYVWYLRRTRGRLRVLLERSTYVLVVEGRAKLTERGPFEVTRGFGVHRTRHGEVFEAALGIASGGTTVAWVTELMPHPPPEDWVEGPIVVGDAPGYRIVGRSCVVEIADKLGSGAAGAIDESDVAWIADALNAGKQKRDRKKKKKAARRPTT